MTAQDKATVRSRARERRGAIPYAIRDKAGNQGAAHFIAMIPLAPNSIVSAFWPMDGEFDSLPLINALQQAGHQIALPVVLGVDQPLCFRRWRPGDAMTVSAFGVSEPLASAPALQPDVVVTPFLAYNNEGFRLGYGGGYYDRTLRALRQAGPGLLAVGLGFAAQEMPALPIDDHDEPMDWLVNERGAQSFVRG